MVSRARLKLLRSLSRASVRVAEGIHLVDGRRLVGEAVASGASVEQVLVTARFRESPEGRELVARASAEGIAVDDLPARELERIADTKSPQGVAAVVRPRAPEADALGADRRLLVLDGVADPGNAGTLIRAADAFGFDGVLAGPGAAGFTNPKVLRAAMGSTFHLPLLRAEDLAAAIAARREGGAAVVAATLDGDDLWSVEPNAGGLCLVLGNEARGVSPEVLDLADRRVTVPCAGRAESLNVATAGAILLAWLARGGAG